MKQRYFLNEIYFFLSLVIFGISFSGDQKIATIIALHDLYHLLLLNEELKPLHNRTDIEVGVAIQQYNSGADITATTHYLRLHDPTVFRDGSRIYDYSLSGYYSDSKTGEVRVISAPSTRRALLQERGMVEILAGVYGPPLAPSIFSIDCLSPVKAKCSKVKISVLVKERVPFKELADGQLSSRRLQQVLEVGPIEHSRRSTIRLGEKFHRSLVEYPYDHHQLSTQRYFLSKPSSSFSGHGHVYRRNHTKTQTVIEEERRVDKAKFGTSGLRCLESGKKV